MPTEPIGSHRRPSRTTPPTPPGTQTMINQHESPDLTTGSYVGQAATPRAQHSTRAAGPAAAVAATGLGYGGAHRVPGRPLCGCADVGRAPARAGCVGVGAAYSS